jgi:hypothetical protein
MTAPSVDKELQGYRGHTWSRPVPQSLHAAMEGDDLSGNDPLSEPAAIPDVA